jgi:hypothetical protein
MDSLQDILGKRDFTPPDEIASVKEFILRRYKSPSTLQLEQRRMIEACRIKKKLIIRYGHY